MPAIPAELRPRLSLLTAIFLALHLACVAAFWLPFRWWMPLLALGSYYARMFAVTAGYHRYFSHRSFRLDRVSQFLLAFLAQTSAQKGVLWWASRHRDHHRHSDGEADIHSPLTKGFWYAHVGWVMSDAHDGYDAGNIPDFEKYPELRFLSRHHWICPWTLGVASFLAGGWIGLVWGFVIPTVLLFHGTFTINSLCHIWGSRRFETGDGSRNNLFLALLTLGEGWHNNHHYFQSSCRQGIRWWEVDPTYYVLKALSWVRVVRDIRPFPARLRADS